ncbi:MAG TPA: long-chain fatty acid--CoA ligase, partial [Caldithrix abyssi]|nr:long-chain fatty acid--CoA ligase [Caldithrix abyssi]
DYATLSLGAMLVPIYPSLLSDQIKYICDDSEAKVLIVADKIQMDKVDQVHEQLKTVQNFYVFDVPSEGLKDPWKSFESLMEDGQKFLADKPDYVQNEIAKVEPQDWATIIYTSGTTGEPKGAVLTHSNFLSNVEDALSVIDITSEDVFLSFLPLSHVFERMAGHYLSNYPGATVAYAESIDTVPENMVEIKPTMMVSVPRLYEKMYARILEAVEAGPPLKRKIFYWALKVGSEYIDRVSKKQPIPGGLQFKRNLAYKLVFSKLAERVGGRLRLFVSGGAPLNKEIAEFFGAAGLLILEGYGLTETSPVITVNLPDHFKFGTVGPPLPSVEVKIAEDGEILTRGPHVMVGYYKKEAETREAIDEEGWFHTGDIGIIDEDGFLKITDRKKNIIVTSGGKNVAPQPIENRLIQSPYIEQAVVIGDKRKFCSAVVVGTEDQIIKWAKENNIAFTDYQDLIRKPEVKQLLREEIDNLTKDLARYETIKDFFIAPQPFTIETGDLTPSLKVKRRVVEEKYKKEIDAMYDV